MLNDYREQIVIVAASEYSCCGCGKPLRPRFCGISARISPSPYPLLFLVCDTACQNSGLHHFSREGIESQPFTPEAVRLLLDHEKQIAGFAQGRHWGPVVILEPYGADTRVSDGLRSD